MRSYVAVGVLAVACSLPVARAQDADLTALSAKAQAALDSRDLFGAEGLFKQVLERDPKNVNAHVQLGRIYRWQKRNTDAFVMLQRAVELDNESAVAHLYLGLHYSEQPGTEQAAPAIPHLRKAIGALPPDLVSGGQNLKMNARLTLGRVLEDRRDLDGARAEYVAAHDSDPANAIVVRRLGDLDLQRGAFGDARTWFDKLSKLRPDDTEVADVLKVIAGKQETARIEVEVGPDLIEVGGALPRSAITFRGLDAEGRIVDFEQHWEVSAGLTLVSMDPLVIQAKAAPSNEEYVYLYDKANGNFAKAPVRVIGPPVKLALDLERMMRAPGQAAIVRLSGVDSAGNQFPAAKATWVVQKAGAPVAGIAISATADNRYRIDVPADTPIGTYAVIATVDQMRIVGQLDVVDFEKPEKGVAWSLDLAKAKATARAANKPLLVLLWTIDSSDSEKLNAEVLTDPRIMEQMKLFVPVRVNAANAPDMVSMYKVESIPTSIVLSASGAYVDRMMGNLTADAYFTWMLSKSKVATEIEGKLEALRAEAAKPDASGTASQLLGNACREHILNDEATAAYERALKTDLPKAQRHQVLLSLVFIRHVQRDYAKVESLTSTVLAEEPEAEAEARALLFKAISLGYGLAQEDKANAMLDEVIHKFPKSQAAKRAQRIEEMVGEIKWHSSIEDALDAADAENKPIFVDFFSTTCIPCMRMEKETWPSDEFKKVAGNWVLLRIDLDKQPEYGPVYKIKDLPALAIWTKHGCEVEIQMSAYKQGSEVVDYMAQAKSKIAQLTSQVEELREKATNPDNADKPDAYVELGKLFSDRKAYSEAAASYQSAFHTYTRTEKAEKAIELCPRILNARLQALQHDLALSAAEEWIEKYPTSKDVEYGHYVKALCLLRTDKMDAAKEHILAMEKQFGAKNERVERAFKAYQKYAKKPIR